MNRDQLSRQHETKTIADLIHLYENGMLDLSPAFQRRSVWALRDRQRLIDTIARNYPLPAIFLYRTEEAGRLGYAVIDGKQRLETILGFVGKLRGASFEAKVEVPGLDGVQVVSSRTLKTTKVHRERLWPAFIGYKVPVIEVSGGLADIIEVFVRINSTGKPLTPQERRKAQYSGSALLVEATKLANKFEGYLSQGILSAQQVARMKHVELVAELIVTAERGDVINKKSAVDKVMASSDLKAAVLAKASGKVQSALNRIGKMFPDLRTTRFHQLVDFYSLVGLIMKLESEGAVLTDRRRNAQAWSLLKAFGVGVDEIREAQRKLKTIPRERTVYADYLLTVSQMTDDINQRRRREAIVRSVIGSVLAFKDHQRGFTREQRRILWNSEAERLCSICGKEMHWNDLSIDHIHPFSKGGRAALDNAAIAHARCNSSKGNRLRASRQRASG